MAGSKVPMIYITDIPTDDGLDKKRIILNLDESNSLATGGVQATTAARAGLEFATFGEDYLRLEPRVLYVQGTTAAGKTVRRSFVACDPDNDLVNGEGTVPISVSGANGTAETVQASPSGVVGEKRTFVVDEDTGLDDGTA